MMNNETGRSMVEMLGVLAIIGVLSVAGIAGYTMAMNKYRANEIVNAASQVAMLAVAQAETTGNTANVTAEAAGYKSKVGGVTASSIYADTATNTISVGTTDYATEIGAITGCKIGRFNLSVANECSS